MTEVPGMYSSYPQPYRVLLRTTLSAAWGLVAVGGLSALAWTPTTIESQLGTILTYVWGAIAALGGVVAFYGVAFNRYRFEWVAAWFSAIGMFIYGSVVWGLVIEGSITRSTQGSFITALFFFSATRFLTCAAHAARLRLILDEIKAAEDDAG